jgi:hypothetical protein
MSEPQVKRFPFAKIVIVLAIVFVLSLGLCGGTAAFSSASQGQQNSVVVFFFVSIAGMLLSGLGLFVMIPIWIIAVATRNPGSEASEPQKLLDDMNKEDKKE